MDAALARLGACATLAEAIVVGLRLDPPWAVVSVVVQDEFTHDIVFAPDGGAGEAVVLDCT
jgi:hypothetical protein